MDILRFTTAGSVDNGKSTLIGRLLFDSKVVFQDQLDELARSGMQRGEQQINLAHLTDGLRAEREQGITIDVAYRYFSTSKRKFIIADTPGHFHFTRNMVTGASTAQVALVLIDATQGATEQTNRHLFIALLLGIKHIVVCVNKMDLIGFSNERFNEISMSCREFFRDITDCHFTFIPVSALRGDNVVESSLNMPWYMGPTLMGFLSNVSTASAAYSQAFRMPVQLASCSGKHGTRFMGRIAGGLVRVGQKVMVLPQRIETEIIGIEVGEKKVDLALANQSVSVTPSDNLMAERGCMLTDLLQAPRALKELEATLCWFSEQPHLPGSTYKMMHTTRTVNCKIIEVRFIYNMLTLQEAPPVSNPTMNDIFRARLQLDKEIFSDPYKLNRTTGSFILIDPATNNTVAAGMIS